MTNGLGGLLYVRHNVLIDIYSVLLTAKFYFQVGKNPRTFQLAATSDNRVRFFLYHFYFLLTRWSY